MIFSETDMAIYRRRSANEVNEIVISRDLQRNSTND